MVLESEVDKHIETLFSGTTWGTWGTRQSWEAGGHGTNTTTSSSKKKVSYMCLEISVKGSLFRKWRCNCANLKVDNIK